MGPLEVGDVATLLEQIARVQQVIQTQLEAAAAQVEREAVGVTQEACDVHSIVARHRRNALELIDRLMKFREVSEALSRAGTSREDLVDGIFGQDGQGPPVDPGTLKLRIQEHARWLEVDLRGHGDEHGEMLHAFRPLLQGMQSFDGIRQLIEHSMQALAALSEVIARARAGQLDPRDARAALDELFSEGLRSIYFTSAEQAVLPAGARGAPALRSGLQGGR